MICTAAAFMIILKSKVSFTPAIKDVYDEGKSAREVLAIRLLIHDASYDM